MLIIWKGVGWTVLPLYIAFYIGTQITVEVIYGEGYSDTHVWQIYISTIASAILVAILGYWFNYKKRHLIVDDETGESRLSPRHTFFFIPVEYWAILMPVIISYFAYDSAQENKQSKIYLSSPKLGDVYVVDFKALIDEYEEKYPYGTLKITSVEKEFIEVVPSLPIYNLSSGPKKDIRDGKTELPNYFSPPSFPLMRAELQELHQQKIIIFVSRKEQ